MALQWLPKMVEGRHHFVTAGASANNHVPFSAEEILVVFRHTPDGSQSAYPIPSQLLMLYYVLLYQDCYLTNLKALCTCVSVPHR